LPCHFQKEFNDNTWEPNILLRFLNLFYYFYNYYNVDYFFDIYNIGIKDNTFDFTNKYLIHKKDNITYIKLRLCDFDIWENILSKIFDIKIKLIKHNETSKKESIGELYKVFNEKIYLTYYYYNLLKYNKSFMFYYSPNEQNDYLRKFNNKIKLQNFKIYDYELIEHYYNTLIKNKAFEKYGYKVWMTNKYLISICNCLECYKKRNDVFTREEINYK
jgi:hypothetical protein